MDGLTSTYSKLHDAQVPLKERTELSRYILEGSDCFFPNKNQVLTDWLCQELHHLRISQAKKDGEVSLDVRKNQAELWKLLHEVLSSPLSEHIMVRQKFLSVLFEELARSNNYFEDSIGDDIMDEVYHSCALSAFLCCQDMLKNVQISLLLFNRLENVEQLLTQVLSCFLAVQSIKSGTLVEELCSLVTLVLQQYGAVQHQQVAQRKVFGNLCEKLLGPLLMVKAVIDGENSISTKCNLEEARKQEITSKLDAVIAGGLFHKEHIMNYKIAVDNSKSPDEPSSKKQKISGYPSRLFEVLRTSPVELGLIGGNVHGNNQVTSGLWWRSVCKSLPFLLKSFLEAAKDEQKLERSAKFNFFIELYNLIPLNGGIGNDPAMPQVDRLAILNQMLQVILEYDVYQIAEDNLNNEPLFKWLVKLTECLMQATWDCDVLFQSLCTLLKLNHKIIEQFLEGIIERCLVKSNENPELVRKEKVNVFSNLVETYSKLHQVEHLMKLMLKVIRCSEQNIGPIPVEVLTKLSQAFERCTLNLTLKLYQLFLDEMKSQIDYLKPCFTQGGDPNKGFNGTAIEMITILFVTFLCNSTYSASDLHGLDPQKANALQEFMKTTKVSVLTLLIEAFPVAKRFQKEIGFCALYLLYGLQKVTRYLNHHDVCTVDCGEIQISWSSECGTFIPHQSWGAVEMATKSGKLQFCTDLLAVQRAQCLLASQNPDKKELASLLKFLYNFGDRHANPEVGTCSWNADPCCITTANYPVAHWSLVARHAPLLLPHCGDPEIRRFAKTFLKTLSFSNGSLQDDSLTVTLVSEKLLEANELLGLSSLQTAVVQEFWEIAGESTDKVAGGKFPRLANVFAWSSSEGRPSENQDSEKERMTGNGVMSTLDSEDDETGFQESSKVDAREENVSVNSLESTKAELQYVTSLSEGLAELMNDEAKKMAKIRPKKIDKRAAKHSECLHDIENLLEVLQRLPYPSFTSSNQTRCILSLLACDVLAEKCAARVGGGSLLALQLSCRLSLNALIQGVLRLRDFTTWRVVDVRALLSWLHATTVPQDQALDMPKSELHVTHANVSNKLLGLLVKLVLKYRRPAGLTAIRDFNDQLLASVVDEITESDAKNLEIVLTVVSTCAEFLQQKSSKSSARTASAVIVDTAASLLDAIRLFLKGRASAGGSNDGSCSNLEILVLKLSGTITRAIGLLSHAKDSDKEDERLRDWRQIVALVISRVMPTLENEVSSQTSLELAVTCVTVLDHISQFDTEYGDVLPEEFHTWILRICLEILRTRVLRSEAVIDEARPGEDCESDLHDAILRLLSTLLEVNNGENCASLLGSLVDASVQGIDEESHLKLLVGLSVFKKLLANKVVKKRKKDLRSILGKVLITILNSAATANLEVLTVVLEIIAGIVTLGSGTLYPQDLALVFQAFALACNAQVNDQRTFSRLFMARFAILSWTLFYYPDYIYGVIHVFLTCVRDLLSGLLAEGSKSFDDSDLATTVLASCGQKMARLYQEVASHKDVLSKYSPYVLTDCIHLFSTQGIPGSIRDTLIEGVHYLFDVCSDDALTRVHVHLPSTERELFRSIKEDFNKHHKFKGNA